MTDQKKPKGKLADIKRRLSEEVKKQKLGALESEQSAKDLAEDAERLRKEEELEKKSPGDKEIDEALAHSAFQEEKKQKRKKQIKQASIGGGVVFFIYVIYLMFLPFKGTMDFGICKVFLELQVQYPDHLKLNGAEQFRDRVRIWYRTVDAAGEYRLARLECNFKQDETRGRVLGSALVDLAEIDPAIIEKFNVSIPAIRANPPDLTYPIPPPDVLGHVTFDIEALRRPILGN
jgi:hypothetical protein